MNEIELDIPGVKVFQPRTFADERGFLFESFRANWLPDETFVQDNHSQSSKGTLRGLHYQLKNPQGKLVRVVQGEVFDVAVDIRRSSATFGHWSSRVLSADNQEIFWVPPGFAHGFLVLSDSADFVYKCTDYYTPGDEYGIRWNDPQLNIEWPALNAPINLSEKDLQAPFLADASVFA